MRMEYQSPYQSIVLMGKIGAGKGTQADFILERLRGVLYSNGNRMREASKKQTIFGGKIKDMYEQGELMPEWLASYWMVHALVSQYENERIVFEGVAKKPKEAELFHEVHAWVGRPYIVFLINVTDEAVLERSMKRSRDVLDNPPSVEKRLQDFNTYTMRSVEFFREKGVLVEINGMQSTEAVRDEIFKHLIE